MRDEENICVVVERMRELSSDEYMKNSGCGLKILFFIKEFFFKFSIILL